MSELDSLATKFGVSEAVFKITASARELDFQVKDKYSPPMDSADPVEILLAETYYETLNKTIGRFEASVDVRRTYATILMGIKHFVTNASPQKNPKQTKLYKWLYNLNAEYRDSSAVGFIALYRYIVNNNLQDTKDSTNPHAKNVIAVLELMREKYED